MIKHKIIAVKLTIFCKKYQNDFTFCDYHFTLIFEDKETKIFCKIPKTLFKLTRFDYTNTTIKQTQKLQQNKNVLIIRIICVNTSYKQVSRGNTRRFDTYNFIGYWIYSWRYSGALVQWYRSKHLDLVMNFVPMKSTKKRVLDEKLWSRISSPRQNVFILSLCICSFITFSLKFICTFPGHFSRKKW